MVVKFISQKCKWSRLQEIAIGHRAIAFGINSIRVPVLLSGESKRECRITAIDK
jgi:hypothetical protein